MPFIHLKRHYTSLLHARRDARGRPLTLDFLRLVIYIEAGLLPDTDVPAGTIFETKAFPHPFLMRYKITKVGRLIDACGRDLECDGYLEFYHYLDQPAGNRRLAEHRAHFCRGQLDNIVRVRKEPEGADVWVIYGLAAYRIFALGAPSSFMSDESEDVEAPDKLTQKLAGLGYPGFAHLTSVEAKPAAVLLEALVQPDLEVRLVEALPWVVLHHSNLDWQWLVPEITRRAAQNRLGFIVAIAVELAIADVRERLQVVLDTLDNVRLHEENTLCRTSTPAAERKWLATTRSAQPRTGISSPP